MMTPTAAAEQVMLFCFHKIDGTVCLKKTHPYFWQVLGQMACCCVNWCDFAVLSGGKLFVEKVSFDSAAWDCAVNLLRRFYFEHYAPELVYPGYVQEE